MVSEMESTGEVVKTTAGSKSGVTVVRSDAPSDFHMAPRSETPSSIFHPPPPPSYHHTVADPPPENPSGQFISPATENLFSGQIKKKRGRPKKYNGSNGAALTTLSPTPISSAAPQSLPPPPSTSHVIDFSSSEKRGKVKPVIASSFIKSKYQIENLGEWGPATGGANFTPHIITVNAGEDVTKRIISFSQQGSLAICVLCANGVVSSVTLRQPDSSGGTLTYEGRFEILSLSGSFKPSDSDGTRSRTGGMTVSLASPDGRVLGGGVAGLLVSASPVQVVVGSFVANTNQQEQKPKKHKQDFMLSQMATSAIPISSASDQRTIHPMSSLPIPTWTPSSDPRNKPSHDINITLT